MKTAVKAYYRIWKNVAENLAALEACDRQYDGGEWSGPAWNSIWGEEEDRVVADIAKVFQVDPDELSDEIYKYGCDQQDYYREAKGGVPTIYE